MRHRRGDEYSDGGFSGLYEWEVLSRFDRESEGGGPRILEGGEGLV